MKANIINDKEKWLKCLSSRNNITHAYNQIIALEIVKDTKEIYYDMFLQLKNKIENKWL